MHETLRSSFKLEKDKETEWQRITSDVANNTLFSIYAKFFFEKDLFIPNKCIIKLQNFTGSIAYGIHKVEEEIKFIYDETPGINDFVSFLTIELEAMPEVLDMEKETELKFINYPNSKKNDEFEEFSEKNLLFVNLKFRNKFNEQLDIDKVDADKISFLDSKFYERDGEKVRHKIDYLSYLDNIENIIDMIGTGNLDMGSLSKPLLEHNGGARIMQKEKGSFSVYSKPCRDTYVRFFK